MTDPEELIRQARLVLDFNWTGEYTKPGPRLYPHQWSWDAGLIAIGYAPYDSGRAIAELSHLFSGQWRNGLVPHIVFNPEHSGQYSPGVDFWGAERSPDAPRDPRTSGVVQPPIHATAVLEVQRHAEDSSAARASVEEMFAKLRAWHRYLYAERDPAGTGLAYIRHPWESGMDDSPMWDSLMLRLQLCRGDIPEYERADTRFAAYEDRPTQHQYDRFAYLVRLFAERDYDEARIREDCPFLVEDVLFNTLLCRAGDDLAELADLLGEDPAPFRDAANRTRRAMNERLWDDHHATYFDRDLVSGQPLRVHAAAGFLPLFAGVPDEGIARRMVSRLESSCFGLNDGDLAPVPSYDRFGFGFSPTEYWRGPVWVNVDWFLMRGLERYGYEDHARRLRETIVALVADQGFHEYFDPTTGKGHGSNLFSWTAALLLDVLAESSSG